jgi:phosphoribulokinase
MDLRERRQQDDVKITQFGSSPNIVRRIKSRRMMAYADSRHGKEDKYIHCFDGKVSSKDTTWKTQQYLTGSYQNGS